MHTGVLVEQVARSTDAALLARGGDFGADALTVPIWVGAGRQTGGQAGGVEAVVWALQSWGEEENSARAVPRIPPATSCFCPSRPTGSLTVGDTVTAAVFIFFALGP